YIDTVQVLPATGSYIVYAGLESLTGGHNNGQINPGQSYDMTLSVTNIGTVNATGVTGYLTSSDPYISLDPDTVNFGTVNANDTVVGASPFGFDIDQGTPDGQVIPVTLVCKDANDSTWSSDFNLTVNSPLLGIGGYYGQAMILPGDVVPVGIKLYNTGSGTAHNVLIKMRSLDSYITFTDSTQSVASIAPGDSFFQKGVFSMTVSSSCPNPHSAQMVCNAVSADGCTLVDTFNVGIGNLVFVEDFEDKDTADWTWTGPASWHISVRDAHSPTHSVYCGDEATGVHANGIVNARAVSPEIYVNAGDTMSFWHRYYMFATWDGVQLQISTDGGSSWTMVTTVEGYTSTNGGSGNGFSSGEPYWSGGQGTPWNQQHLVFNVTGNIRLGWKFGSTTVVAYEGYFFDDINMGIASGLGVEEQENPVNGPVVQFALMRAYPNPVRGRAVIGYSVGSEVPVRLAVYDISGRQVSELVNAVQGPGVYRVEWDGRDERGTLVSSGTYFYRIVAGSFTDANKIVVVR
ncbi:choice-of-anchor J domain-containing protein, partial [candidate division WOR-3 bacterium]|nr:choice-of-anchor J domain-containing protein [candidate division WOR-3 bacterium]